MMIEIKPCSDQFSLAEKLWTRETAPLAFINGKSAPEDPF